MKLDFMITNDTKHHMLQKKTAFVLSVAKELALNEQRIKPCVSLGCASLVYHSVRVSASYL